MKDVLVFVMVLCIAILFLSIGASVEGGKYAMQATGIGGLVIAVILWGSAK